MPKPWAASSRSPEDDMFDVEYWSLEQAKLGKAQAQPLARQIAVITGAGCAIGAATAKAFAAAGAEVALLDIDERPSRRRPKRSAARRSRVVATSRIPWKCTQPSTR